MIFERSWRYVHQEYEIETDSLDADPATDLWNGYRGGENGNLYLLFRHRPNDVFLLSWFRKNNVYLLRRVGYQRYLFFHL